MFIAIKKKLARGGRGQQCLGKLRRVTRTQRTTGPKELSQVWVRRTWVRGDPHQAALSYGFSAAGDL